jgi:hypothetical protein
MRRVSCGRCGNEIDPEGPDTRCSCGSVDVRSGEVYLVQTYAAAFGIEPPPGIIFTEE